MYDIYGIKLFTHLRLNLSHLNEHKFRNNFNDTINPMCNCSATTETIIHYLLCCRLYSVQRVELLNGAYKLDSTLQKFAVNINKEIIRLAVSYLKASERFVQPLFWPTKFVFICIFSLSIHLLFLYVILYRTYCKWLYPTWVLCLVSFSFWYYFLHLLFYC